MAYRFEIYEVAICPLRNSFAWSDDDRSFIGRVVEFPSLAAHGETLDAALREINKVVKYVLADLAENNEPIAAPLSKRRDSGRLNVRLTPQLHRRLLAEAASEGVSLDQLLTIKLSSHDSH